MSKRRQRYSLKQLRCVRSWHIIAGLGGILVAATVAVAAHADLPTPLMHLAGIDPTIIEDMRYAGANNFTGSAVPGYDAPACILARPVALALARVQADLRPLGLSLKVYDCYRPERAARAFVDWARQPADAWGRQFFPRTEKSQLFAIGYIARRSSHANGGAVDLTLVKLPEAVATVEPDRLYGSCNSPEALRAPDSSVDMGTGYDCFDVLSGINPAGLTPEQGRMRRTLADAMTRRGFQGLPKEWWHFTFPGISAVTFDVPVTANTRVAPAGKAPAGK